MDLGDSALGGAHMDMRDQRIYRSNYIGVKLKVQSLTPLILIPRHLHLRNPPPESYTLDESRTVTSQHLNECFSCACHVV